MKATDLKEKTAEELQHLLEETQRELGDLRMMQRVGDGSQSMIKTRNLRREIARIKTVLNERQTTAA